MAEQAQETERVAQALVALRQMAALYEGERVRPGASEADDAVLSARAALAAWGIGG